MILMPGIAPHKCMGTSACTVFIFKEGNIFFLVMPFHEILIDTELPMMKIASACQTGIYLVLRNKIFMQNLYIVLCRIFPFFCA